MKFAPIGPSSRRCQPCQAPFFGSAVVRNDGNIGVSAVYYGAPRADSGHLSKLDEACRKGGPQSCTAWSMAAFSPVLASHFATKHLVTHWEVDGSKDFLRFSGFLFDFSDLFTDLARACWGFLEPTSSSCESVWCAKSHSGPVRP